MALPQLETFPPTYRDAIRHRKPEEVLWPHPREAKKLLAEYRSSLEGLFPFVVIPPDMTSEEMREQRPFLWKGIMMETCHLDGMRQIVLGEQLLKDITEAAYIKGKKSLDLLQGLQILVAWFHYNLHSFQMTNLLFLMRSVCIGLGFIESRNMPQREAQGSHCLEQMRAYAGTYYLITL